MRYFQSILAVVVAALFSLTSSARAAVVVTPNSQHSAATNFTPYVVSTSDLIQGATPTASSGDFTVASTGLSALTDGGFTYTGNSAVFASAGTGTGTSVTYSLGAFPQGYNVSGIDVYGGWTGPNSFGRDGQGYHLYYSTDGGTNFSSLEVLNPAYSFQPSDTGDKVGTRVSFTDTASVLASGVTHVRFDFDVPVLNSWSGYAEIDVFGTQVPEPASAALVMISLTSLGLRRRQTPR